MRIQAKLLLFAILCSVIPLLGAFVLSFSAARDSLNQTVEENLLAQATEEMANLQRSLADARHELATISKFSNMQNVLTADASGSLQKDLDLFAQRTPLFAEIIAADSEGLAVAGTLQNFVNKDLSGTWEYEAPRLGIQFDGAVVRSYRLNRNIATQSVPLYLDGDSNTIIGALIGSIDWFHLQQNLASHSVFGGEQSRQRQVFLESVRDNSLLYGTRGIEIPSELLATAETNSRVRQVTYNGREYKMVSVKSRPFGEFRDPLWRLHILLDSEVAYESANALKEYFILAAAGVLILALGLGAILARTIVNPVKSLLASAERLAAGNYDVELKETGARDEIGQLTSSFNAMRLAVRKNRAELVQKSEVAEEAARLKGEFLANMSHEVRTPINGVLGMTELLLNTELNGTQSRYARTISRSGQTLLTVINDILDFSKIEAGKLELAAGAFDLRDLAEDVIEMLAERAHRKGVELALYMAPDCHTAFNGDSGRLRQVLTNLVGNAVKFTSEGEVQLHVSVTDNDTNSSTVNFQVTDTGVGIEEENLNSIFESFVQADGTTTRLYGGTGLGLAISSKLVVLMGGQIGVESTKGEGSTFRFALKMERLSSNVEQAWRTPGALKGKRILIVDDNRTNCEILENQVDFWGAHPYVTTSGAEALHEISAAVESNMAFDAVVLDMHMPGMSGIEVATKIAEKGQSPDTRLILLSSACDQLDLQTCQSIGINSMITKPVRQPELYNCLTAAIVLGEEKGVNTKLVTQKIESNTISGDVLLAEDNPVNQDMMLELLRLIGVDAVLAQNGEEVLAELAKQSFDVVLMDCQMPVMDGFAATRTIREQEAQRADEEHQVIVALTANALQGDKERCLESGMDDYLSKPVSAAQLKELLGKWISAKKSPVNDKPSTDNVVSFTELSSTSNNKIIDAAVFGQVWDMCEQASQGFYEELVDKYDTGSHEDIEIIESAMGEGDIVTVASRAHRLKSSSANLGSAQLTKICQALETSAKNQKSDHAKILIPQLKKEHLRFLRELKLHKNKIA